MFSVSLKWPCWLRVEERGNCFIPQPQGYFNIWGLIRYDGSGLGLTAEVLTKRVELPLGWTEQTAVLGGE